MARMKKYVFDTNLLLNNLDTLKEVIERGDVAVIPLQVIEELDNMKGRGSNEERKYNARVVLREIAKYETEIEMVSELSDEKLMVAESHNFDMSYQDNRILSLDILSNDDTVLLTMDKSMRFKARAMGIAVEVVDKADEDDYNGKLTVESNSVATSKFQSNGFVLPCDLDLIESDLYPNQIIKMKTFSGYDTGRYIKQEGKIKRLIHKSTEVSNIKVRNLEQQMLLDVLSDPKVKIITVSGRAGTGKTLLTLAWALEEFKRNNVYDKMLLGKNTAPIDKWSYQGKIIASLGGNI